MTEYGQLTEEFNAAHSWVTESRIVVATNLADLYTKLGGSESQLSDDRDVGEEHSRVLILNRLAREGWELVAAAPERWRSVYLFRRSASEEK